MKALAIPVPERLTRPHPVITATRSAAQGLKPGPDGRLDIGRKEGILHLQVSRQLLSRALRIGQAIFAEAERRGYEVRQVEKSYNHAAGIGIAIDSQVALLRTEEECGRS